MARAGSITFQEFRARFSTENACRAELFRLRFKPISKKINRYGGYMSLLESVMRCYNTNNFENLSAILSPNCKYSSHWVLDVMVGNDEIENYLIQKSHAIESAKAFVVAKKGIITSPNNGECIVLFQKGCVENGPSCLLILKERNGKICGIHITDPGLFQFSIVE